jgi:hypothetical protein
MNNPRFQLGVGESRASPFETAPSPIVSLSFGGDARRGASQKAYPVVIAGFYFRRTNKRNRRRRQIKFGRVRGCLERPIPSSLRGRTTKQSGYYQRFPDCFTSFAMTNRTFRDSPIKSGACFYRALHATPVHESAIMRSSLVIVP